MSSKVDTFSSLAIAVAALAVGGTIAYRNLVLANGGKQEESLTRIEGWDEGLALSRHVAGDTNAPITIMELADFQCPACKGYQPVIDSIVKAHPGRVRLVFVHFPLSYHEYAVPAARVAECATGQGEFAKWIETAYRHQDSLGTLSWGTLAYRAGISDTARMNQCATAETPVVAIEMGPAFARDKAKASGTPTLLINGWRFRIPPTRFQLEKTIELLLDGKDPRLAFS